MIAASIAATLAAGTWLPFVPGSFDPFAVPVSATLHALGVIGVALVPIGALWLLAEHRRWPRRRACAIGAGVVASAVSIMTTLAGLAHGGYLLAALAAAGALSVLTAIRRRLRSTPELASTIAVLMMVLPLVVLAAQLLTVSHAVAFSRSRAIANSAQLVADIERYRREYGRYPLSMAALHPDYKVGVIGIERYGYEPNGEAYNIFFEQFTFYPLGTREIVMYNPLDEQAATGHAAHRLEHPPDRLSHVRGFYAVHDAGPAHWKYFWFD